MKTLMIALTLLSSPVARGQTDFEPLRPELTRAGDAFLDEKSTADDFIAEARALRSKSPFTEDERAYLTDLTRKLPSDLRESVCPSLEEGLCKPTPVGLVETTLAMAAAKKGSVTAEPRKTETSWSEPAKWAIAFGLILAAGSAAMKGKEIQVSFR